MESAVDYILARIVATTSAVGLGRATIPPGYGSELLRLQRRAWGEPIFSRHVDKGKWKAGRNWQCDLFGNQHCLRPSS